MHQLSQIIHFCKTIYNTTVLSCYPMAHPDTSHISFTYPPAASIWVITLHYMLCNRTHPYPATLLSYWLRLFSSQTFSRMDTPTFLEFSHSTLPAYEDGTDSVPKRRNITFRRREITRKKTYNNALHVSNGLSVHH
jgi:hypothetical protein